MTKSKAKKDPNAPAKPRTGYILFMSETRNGIQQENPEIKMAEMNRILGERWQQLPQERKKTYNDKAKEEKETYDKLWAAYVKTDSHKEFQKKLQNKQIRDRKRKRDEAAGETEFDDNLKEGDIPIFTKEFLEHNRKREAELRKLRKEVIDLEEEQRQLEERLQGLESATAQIEMENEETRQHNVAMEKQLQQIRVSLVHAFGKVPLPESGKTPTLDSVDQYMATVHRLLLDCPNENQDFLAKVRQIVTKLKLPTTPKT